VKNGIGNDCPFEKSCALRTSTVNSLETKNTLVKAIKNVYQRIMP
jgi:hypothetical protein